MAEVQERHRKAAEEWAESIEIRIDTASSWAARHAYAQALANTDAQFVKWFDKGCPGLDRAQFVAFGTAVMLSAMRESIERGDPWSGDG